MKRNRRLLSLLVAVCMFVGMTCAVSATGEEATVTYGASIGTADAIDNGQYIVFGNNAAQWFVLDSKSTTTDEAGVVLISKDILTTNIAFNAGGLENSWANSDAKTWNAEYAASAFSAAELAAIMETTKAEEAGNYFGANWGNDALAAEKLFFLSAAEIQDYFGNSIEGLIASCEGVTDGWWIRSAYTDRGIYGGIVSDAGFVGYPHVAATWGARPAFNISNSAIVLTSAAVGGKVSGEVGADGLIAVADATTNEWKLTIADAAHSTFAATIGNGEAKLEQTLGYESWVLPVTYSGAVAGDNEYVSVMICNQVGNAVYYGHIAANSASGTVNVNMPVGLSGKYTIYVFAEQCNGDNKTDFGSSLVSADIQINDGMSSVNSWGLILEGDIRADFKMDLTDAVVADPDAYISVTVDGLTRNTKISDLNADENGFYTISANVAAAQMTEEITLQVIANDKQGSAFIYSVRTYGDYIIENHQDAKTVDLVRAMLNYGGKAQDYFGYNLGNKVDNGISLVNNTIPYSENVAAIKEGSSDKVTYYGSSLVHEHQTSLRFYFKATAQAISEVTFTASVGGNIIESDMAVHQANDMYYVEVSDIAPNALCDLITISVDGFSVSYSPFYYMHRMYYRNTSSDVLRELVAAMYNYYCYAVAYLGA